MASIVRSLTLFILLHAQEEHEDHMIIMLFFFLTNKSKTINLDFCDIHHYPLLISLFLFTHVSSGQQICPYFLKLIHMPMTPHLPPLPHLVFSQIASFFLVASLVFVYTLIPLLNNQFWMVNIDSYSTFMFVMICLFPLIFSFYLSHFQ